MVKLLEPQHRTTVHSEAEPAPTDVPQVTDPRIAAMLPAQLIGPGELVILLIKPSPWFIVLESLRFLSVVAGLLALGLVAARHDYLHMSSIDLCLIATGLAGIRLVWQLLEWLSRVYVLTDRRVIRVMGVLRVHVFETQLKNIQHTATYFSIRERLFGLGTIGFATAGTGVIEAVWRMVAKPLDVHRIVVQTINRYK